MWTPSAGCPTHLISPAFSSHASPGGITVQEVILIPRHYTTHTGLPHRNVFLLSIQAVAWLYIVQKSVLQEPMTPEESQNHGENVQWECESVSNKGKERIKEAGWIGTNAEEHADI